VRTYYHWSMEGIDFVRYALPAGAEQAKLARTHVYGYLLATVRPRGVNDRDPIGFEFHEVGEAAVPAAVMARFGEAFVRQCYEQNVQNIQY